MNIEWEEIFRNIKVAELSGSFFILLSSTMTNKCTIVSQIITLIVLYVFRYYCVSHNELVVNTLPSYTTISNAAVGNTIYNKDVSHKFYASSHIIVVELSITSTYRLYIQPPQHYSNINIQTVYTATTALQ